ncbi:MAG TPA: ABC transporter permease, partial [Anaerolineae bacterium]
MTTYDNTTSASRLSVTPPRRPFLSRFLKWEWFLVLLIVLVTLVNSTLSPYFLNFQNLARSSSDFMEMGLMMLPMVFIIVTGNIDLSVASMLGMTASALGLLFMSGVNIWVATAVALALGAVAGLINGYLISRLKVPALVITLGTYAFYRGVAYVLLGDQAARDYPDAFTYIGQGTLPGTPIPVSALLFAVMAVIFGLVLHKTIFGRYLFAIGSNQNAAVYSGVPVSRVKVSIFLLSGIMSALAGVV